MNDISDYRKELSEPETSAPLATLGTSEESKRNDENRIASGALNEEPPKLSNDTSRDSSDLSKTSLEKAEPQTGNAHHHRDPASPKSTQSPRSLKRAESHKKHRRVTSATGHFAESVLGHSLKCQHPSLNF